MNCLSCWESISDEDKICPYCGSDQNELKEFFTLAVIATGKEVIALPKRPALLEILKEIDPTIEQKFVFAEDSPQEQEAPYRPTTVPPGFATQGPHGSNYAPSNTVSPSQPITKSPDDTLETSIPITICPNCRNEVPFRKFCKICGFNLAIECSNCYNLNKSTGKFCTKCGNKLTTDNAEYSDSTNSQ